LAKRLIDVVGAALGLILLWPVFGAVAVLILVVDGRPILFRQERVRMGGRCFTVSKFRTMVPDAEARQAALGSSNEVRGPSFKMTEDPRLTRTGSFLRRSSLDELPQLWNVLKGEMSLVGPRPPLPSEVADYAPWHRRRLTVKPGLTGLWQISARRDDDFDRWVAFDLAYIDRWSLLLDLRILIRTVFVVLAFEGR
jgi:lipopolysaccharide/colanic/teichoic acid biosynthesis glycosyltransferase